jgi:outer membrane protein OmpA-like peptidoglycan-associated protein
MRKHVCSVLALAAIGLVSFAPSSARAQTPTQTRTSGFSVNHFDPSERGSEWFVLESLDLRGNLRPAIGIVGEWGWRPLVETDGNGHILHSIVLNQEVIHPGASLVLWDRLRVGLDVPVQVYADGHPAVINGVTYSPPASSTSMGDIRLGADLRLFGTYGEAITGALGFEFYFPTGDPASYSGDGSVRVAPRVLVAGDLGPFVYAAKLGTMIRSLDTSYAGTEVGTNIFFGVSAGVRVFDKKFVVGPELFGNSVVTNGAFFTTHATPVEGLFGAHLTLADDWRIGGGASTGLTGGYGTPVVRGVVTLEWAPAMPPPDRDHDGVLDKDDACPDVPGVKSQDPLSNGCPLPEDRDHDGVLDKDDACPDVPGVKTDDPKTNGCPSDRDHDGVLDKEDACPDEPGIETLDPKTNGCPRPKDRDHDGVLDKDDACPDVAGVKTEDPKTNGCPPDPDRDKDGIPNEQDACPDQPGKPNADPKKNGCPEAFVQAGQIKILDQVKFKTGSAQIIGQQSEEVLQAVLGVLKDHPEIKKVRIEGHTDNRGAAAMNKKLSAARAASVVKWLVAHGIDGANLSSEGFGPDRPIDSNDTDAGRQENRRVEFHIEN